MLSPWEEEGRRQAAALDGCGFVLVVGGDPIAAAELALGIGRVQARRRRVAVADAVGELGPIEDLAPMNAAHGIADVFVRGLPLEQAAHRVDAAGNLHVLPSGSGPLDYGAVLRSARWEGLSAEFREAEALLLVVVPNDEPAVDALAAARGRRRAAWDACSRSWARACCSMCAVPDPGGHDMERVTGAISALTQPQGDRETSASSARPSTVRAVAPPPPRRSSAPAWIGALAVLALLARRSLALRHPGTQRVAASRSGAGGHFARGGDRRRDRLGDHSGGWRHAALRPRLPASAPRARRLER